MSIKLEQSIVLVNSLSRQLVATHTDKMHITTYLHTRYDLAIVLYFVFALWLVLIHMTVAEQ